MRSNADAAGLMLRGYEPVAYFTTGNATKGSSEFSATHDGATYRFASAANRDAFKANPAKYQPQFGGFCAKGVALGKKLDGDLEVFRLVDGAESPAPDIVGLTSRACGSRVTGLLRHPTI